MLTEMSPRDWFDHHVYGVEPPPPASWAGDGEPPVVTLTLRDAGGELPIRLRVELPDVTPAPAVVALNFKGNDSTLPGGERASRWPADLITGRGYALVTFHADDVDADRDDFTDGVHRLLALPTDPRPADGTGTLAAWAWGLSRVLDWMLTRPEFDANRIAVLGHSRMGKAALLSAARDGRWAAVISNCSGCGGAALFRGKTGERIDDITRRFPHWFCPALNEWRGRDEEVPHDQDALLRLVAPRPVLVLSAAEDAWADPAAERRCAEDAGVEYRLRPGGHDLTRQDWSDALDFLDRRLG